MKKAAVIRKCIKTSENSIYIFCRGLDGLIIIEESIYILCRGLDGLIIIEESIYYAEGLMG